MSLKPFNEVAAALGIEVLHHFSSGIYAKEVRIPANTLLESHKHNYDHLSILASGSVKLTYADETVVMHAPCCLTIKAHKKHSVIALDNVVWYCIHPSKDTDVTTVDKGLIHE